MVKYSKKTRLALIAIFFVVSACAHKPQPSLAQLDESLTVNKQASTRAYPGKTKEQVRSASQQVLYLLDPPDMQFDVRDDELLATRFSTFYAVFSYGMGRDWYSVTLESSKGVTKSTFGLYGEMNSGLPPRIPVSYKSNIPVSAHDNPADYRLFHDRVEYILGLREIWPTCEAAKKELKDSGQKMMLCDLIGLEDHSPESLKTSGH